MEDIIMSKWRKPLKNKKRFDARYFLNERVNVQEEVVENSVQQEELKKNFHDFSFNNWLDEGADKGTPSWDNDGKIDYEGDVSDEDVFEEGEETVIGDEEGEAKYGEPMEESGDKQAKLAQLKKELEVLDREYRQAQFGSEEEAQVSMAMSRVKGKIEQLGKSDIEELQLGGEPKMSGDAKGMTPREIAIARAKERAKNAREKAKKQGLGPVVDEA